MDKAQNYQLKDATILEDEVSVRFKELETELQKIEKTKNSNKSSPNYLVDQISKAKEHIYQRKIEVINLQNEVYKLLETQNHFNEKFKKIEISTKNETAALAAKLQELNNEKIILERSCLTSKEENSALNHQLAHLQSQILIHENLISEARTEKIELSHKIEQLKNLVTEKDSEINDLITKILNFSERIESYKNNDLKKSEEIDVIIQQKIQTENALARTKKDIYGFINELEKTELEKTELNFKLQAMTDDYNTSVQKNIELSSEMTIAYEKYESTVRDLNRIESQYQNLSQQHSQLLTQNKDLNLKIAQLESQQEKLNRTNSDKDNEIEKLKVEKLATESAFNTEIEKLKVEKLATESAFNTEIEKLKVEKLATESAFNKKNQELQFLLETERNRYKHNIEESNVKNKDLEKRLNQSNIDQTKIKQLLHEKDIELSQACNETKIMQSQMKSTIENLEHQIMNEKNKHFSISEKLEKTLSLLNDTENKVLSKNSDLEIAKKEIDAFKDKISNLELSLQDTLDKNQQYQDSLNKSETEINQMMLTHEKRNKDFSKFVTFFEMEKDKANKVLSQLSIEIHQAITLHPLKDYLQATEIELSRKELELKKISSSSPIRKNIEKQLEQLFEQRNTTRDLITATEKHLLKQDSKTHKLSSYIESLAVPKAI